MSRRAGASCDPIRMYPVTPADERSPREPPGLLDLTPQLPGPGADTGGIDEVYPEGPKPDKRSCDPRTIELEKINTGYKVSVGDYAPMAFGACCDPPGMTVITDDDNEGASCDPRIYSSVTQVDGRPPRQHPKEDQNDDKAEGSCQRCFVALWHCLTGFVERPPVCWLVSIVRLLLIVLGMVLYVLDVFSDVQAGIAYFQAGRPLWGSLILVFVVLPLVSWAAISWTWLYCDPEKEEHPTYNRMRMLLAVLLLDPLVRQLEAFWYSCRREYCKQKCYERCGSNETPVGDSCKTEVETVDEPFDSECDDPPPPAENSGMELFHLPQTGPFGASCDTWTDYPSTIITGREQQDKNNNTNTPEYWSELLTKEKCHGAFLTAISTLLEDAPQITIQLYIMMGNGVQSSFMGYVQIFQISTSVASLCFATAQFPRQVRLRRPEIEQIKTFSLATLALFLWRLLTVGSRVLIFALFALLFHAWLFAIIGFHFVIMVAFVYYQMYLSDRELVVKIIYNIVTPFVYIFDYCINWLPGPTRFWYIICYVPMFFENLLMCFLVLWYRPSVSVLNEGEYIVPLCICIMLMFPAGVFVQVAYYTCCHTAKNSWSEKWNAFKDKVRRDVNDSRPGRRSAEYPHSA